MKKKGGLGGLFAVILVIGIILYFCAYILPIACAVWVFIAWLNSSQSKKINATPWQCPNCRSTNLHIHSIKTGTTSDTRRTGAIGGTTIGRYGIATGASNSHRDSNYKFKREAVCDDCGFNFDYLTQDDVRTIQAESSTSFMIAILCLFGSICLSFWIMTNVFTDDAKESTQRVETVVEESSEAKEHSEVRENTKEYCNTIADELEEINNEIENSLNEDNAEYVEFMQGTSDFNVGWIEKINANEYKLEPSTYKIEILTCEGSAKGGNIMIEDITQTDEAGYVVIHESGIQTAPYSEEIKISENNLLYMTVNEYLKITKID